MQHTCNRVGIKVRSRVRVRARISFRVRVRLVRVRLAQLAKCAARLVKHRLTEYALQHHLTVTISLP